MHSARRVARSTLLCSVLALAACMGDLDSGPLRPGNGERRPDEPREGLIPLTPPDGVGERALRCEADHAPLRRLSHREYERTVHALFEGVEIPTLMVAPDQRRAGFTNGYEGQAPSALLVTQYLENAQRIAPVAAPAVISELGCSDGRECFRRFVTDFGARAYRRPLEPSELDAYSSIYESGPLAGDFAVSVELAIATFLQAPELLYRAELGGDDGLLTQWEIASRLSYFVWGTMPDDALFDAAARGELSGTTLRDHVDRMLADPRAREGLVSATLEWLDLERLATRLKAEEYEFTPEVRAHLRASVERFVWERLFVEGGSIDELYTSTGAYVDSTIGPLFGVDDAGPELEWRELPHRHGILTHPAILATHAHGDYGSPVLRGVFVLTEILCDPPRPPPPGVAMTMPERTDDSGMAITNREGYERLTQSSPSCAGCHDQINPLGFAFESYDTVGAYRTDDRGLPLDTTGASLGFTLDERFEFDGAEELTAQLGESARARACVVDRWVRYASGGGALAYDPCLRRDLQAVVTQPGASLRDLVIAIAVDPRFSASEVVE